MAKCWANNFDRDCSRLPVKKFKISSVTEKKKSKGI